MRQVLGGHQPSIGDVSREAWRFSADNQFAHRGMDAVGADKQVCCRCSAIMKSYFYSIRILLQADASMIQMNHAGGHSCGQKIEQLSAMKMEIGRTEGPLAFVTQ